MVKISEKIDNLIKIINDTVNEFYKQNENVGFNKLLECIDNLISLINELGKLELIESDLNEKIVRLNTILGEAINALEVKDVILLSDILNYDLIEELEGLKEIV